jgi:hypothetical protein
LQISPSKNQISPKLRYIEIKRNKYHNFADMQKYHNIFGTSKTFDLLEASCLPVFRFPASAEGKARLDLPRQATAAPRYAVQVVSVFR